MIHNTNHKNFKCRNKFWIEWLDGCGSNLERKYTILFLLYSVHLVFHGVLCAFWAWAIQFCFLFLVLFSHVPTAVSNDCRYKRAVNAKYCHHTTPDTYVHVHSQLRFPSGTYKKNKNKERTKNNGSSSLASSADRDMEIDTKIAVAMQKQRSREQKNIWKN